MVPWAWQRIGMTHSAMSAVAIRVRVALFMCGDGVRARGSEPLLEECGRVAISFRNSQCVYCSDATVPLETKTLKVPMSRSGATLKSETGTPAICRSTPSLVVLPYPFKDNRFNIAEGMVKVPAEALAVQMMST